MFYISNIFVFLQNIKSIFEFLDMEEQERDGLLQMTDEEKADVAGFLVKHPSIELNCVAFQKEDCFNLNVTVEVSLEREGDFAEGSRSVMAPYFPQVNFTSD